MRGYGFEIWQARDRIHSIDNPVRLDILRFLEDGPKTLNQLVAHTQKAKSTLSALHVPPLLSGGLLEEVPDPRDARIKTYRLVGSRLAQSDIEPRKLRDAVLDYVRDKGVVPLDSLLRVLDLPSLLQSGAHPDYLRGIAERTGRMFAPLLTGESRDAGARELRVVMHRYGLDGLKEGGRKSAVGAFAGWLIDAALEARYGPRATGAVAVSDPR